MSVYEVRQAQQKQQVYGTAPEPDQFQLIPTCPPSTQTILLAGLMNRNATYWFWVDYDIQIPDLTIDWADLGDTMQDDDSGGTSLICQFTNAGYYIGLIFGFNFEWIQERDTDPGWLPIYIYNGGTTEYATAGEAEAEIDGMLNGTAQIGQFDRCPLWGIVLRNDGRVGEEGAVLPVDAQNRGRSYIYRDARQRWPLTA